MARRRKKIPTEPVTITISDLTHEGRGLAEVNGKKLFVSGALPGEEVVARYTWCASQYDEAQVIEVLKPSPDRVEPACQHFDVCGGCSLQHMAPTHQVTSKQNAVLAMFQQFANVQPRTVLPPLIGPEFGYRNKARLGVRYVDKKEKLLIGFRERNGRYLANMDSCKVLHERIGMRLRVIADVLGSLSIYRDIPQLEVAAGDQEVAIIIRHLKAFTNDDLATLTQFASDEDYHLYLQPGGPETVHRLWPTSGAERLTYSLPEHQVELQFHPSDFTQINPIINQQMVSKAIELLQLQPTDHVIDLFCGLGNFTLPIARRCDSVVGVEGSMAMVQRAQDNAAHNNITNAQFFAADLEHPPTDVSWYKASYNKVLLDPPRCGAASMVPALLAWQPERIVYVSCHPATLARDTALLVEQGYQLEAAGVMDMFPHTKHVETIAVFVRG